MNVDIEKAWREGRSWMVPMVVGIVSFIAGSMMKDSKIEIDKIKRETRQQVEAEYNGKLQIAEFKLERMTQDLARTESYYKNSIEKMTAEYDSKIQTLKDKLSTNNSSQYVETVTIKRPDGTIEIRKVSKTEIERMSQEIVAVQVETEKKVRQETSLLLQKQESEHQRQMKETEDKLNLSQTEISNLKSKISAMEKEGHTTIVNMKNFGVHIGIESDIFYLAGVDYDIAPPFYIGLGVSSNLKTGYRGRLSLGVKF